MTLNAGSSALASISREGPGFSHSHLANSFYPAMALLLLLFCGAMKACAQVAEAAVHGEQSVFFGGNISIGHNNYGSRTLIGADITLDANANRRLGVEAEASWLFLRQRAQVHESTYLIGPRIGFYDRGRITASATTLVGGGEFAFPYKYATGSYFVASPGVNAVYWLNRTVRINLLDVEYQWWPQFTYSSLSVVKASAGIQIHLF